MKYYVLEITTFLDGTKDSIGVYTFESEREASASFHSKIGAQMKNVNCKSETVMVIDQSGAIYRQEYFERVEE